MKETEQQKTKVQISSKGADIVVDLFCLCTNRIFYNATQKIISLHVYFIQVAKKDQSPLIFLSYQWGKQPQIKALYNRLTALGYTVWMDIYQMGGGDSLYDKIDRGMRGCRAVVSCVTHKYSLSANCRREVSLADALKKPIIPLLLEQMKWPPDGPMSMVFSELLYINFHRNETMQMTWRCEQFDELVGKIGQFVSSGDSVETKTLPTTQRKEAKTPPTTQRKEAKTPPTAQRKAKAPVTTTHEVGNGKLARKPIAGTATTTKTLDKAVTQSRNDTSSKVDSKPKTQLQNQGPKLARNDNKGYTQQEPQVAENINAHSEPTKSKSCIIL